MTTRTEKNKRRKKRKMKKLARQAAAIVVASVKPSQGTTPEAKPELQGKFGLVMSGKKCVIQIDGFIGGFFGINSAEFKRDLATDAKGATEIEVEINSGGGSVFDAIAIHNALVKHPAKVTTSVVGLAASAATLISQAGSQRNIADNATFMVHEARIFAEGTERQIESRLALLRLANGAYLTSVAGRSGRTADDLRQMYFDGEDHWLSPAEAVEASLADTVTESSEVEASAAASMDQIVEACAGFGATAATAEVETLVSMFSDPEESEEQMNFAAYCKACGYDVNAISDVERGVLMKAHKAKFGTEHDAEFSADDTPVAGAGDDSPAPVAVVEPGDEAPSMGHFARLQMIQSASAGNLDVAAQAEANGWDEDRIKLEARAAGAEARLAVIAGQQAARLEGEAPRFTTSGTKALGKNPTAAADVVATAIMLQSGKDASDLESSGVSEDVINRAMDVGNMAVSGALELLAQNVGQSFDRNASPADMVEQFDARMSSAGSPLSVRGLLKTIVEREIKTRDVVASDCIQDVVQQRSVKCPQRVDVVEVALAGDPENIPVGGQLEHLALKASEFSSGSKLLGSVLDVDLQLALCDSDLGFFDDLGRQYENRKRSSRWKLFTHLIKSKIAWSLDNNIIQGVEAEASLDALELGDLLLEGAKTLAGDPVDLERVYAMGPRNVARKLNNFNQGSTKATIVTSLGDAARNEWEGSFAKICNSSWLKHMGLDGVWFMLPDPKRAPLIRETRVKGYETTRVSIHDQSSDRLGWTAKFVWSTGFDQIADINWVAMDPKTKIVLA